MFDTKVKKKLKVLLPDYLQNEKYVGAIYGYYKKESGIFNVISIEKKVNILLICVNFKSLFSYFKILYDKKHIFCSHIITIYVF